MILVSKINASFSSGYLVKTEVVLSALLAYILKYGCSSDVLVLDLHDSFSPSALSVPLCYVTKHKLKKLAASLHDPDQISLVINK